MKTYAVIMLIVLCPFLPAQSIIMNGYLLEKQMLERKIKSRQDLLEVTGTDKNRKQIEREIKRLKKEYENTYRKFRETEALISKLKQIDPDLFEAVSKVVNAEETLTHVYVRCMSRLEKEFVNFGNQHFNAVAFTSCRPLDENEHICVSRFGTNTITVTVSKCYNSILALAHEFAHVLYIVPNLKTYTEFIIKYRYRLETEKFGGGHHPFDPGIDYVLSIENRFRENYMEYMTHKKKDVSL